MRETVTLSHASRFGPCMPFLVSAFAIPLNEVSDLAYSSNIAFTIPAHLFAISDDDFVPSEMIFARSKP